MSEVAFAITTPRLLIREFVPADASGLYRLNSDSDVMRYTGGTSFQDEGAALRHIQSYLANYRKHGFGRWAVEERSSGQFMGFCGLETSPTSGEVDLAFRFFREFWASGFATEASTTCLKAGFERFGLEKIIGRAMRENLASISVLQKLGMTYRQMDEDQGDFWLIYSISAKHFQGHQD